MSLTLWTVAGIFFGVGIVFIFGIYVGIRIAQRGIEMALEDAAMKGVLEYKNVRFIPVITGKQ